MKKPNQNQIISYSIHFVWLSLLFVFLYGSTNYLASLQEHHFDLYLEIEKEIPFYPTWILIYFSINGMFLLPLFYLSKKKYRFLSFCFAWITIFASLCFYFFPMRLGYPKPDIISSFPFLYEVLYSLEYPHNLFPSLHVAYSFLILRIVLPKTNFIETWIFLIWFFLLLGSVLFTHQHHIIDILGGLCLTEMVLKLTMYGKRKRWWLFRRNRT